MVDLPLRGINFDSTYPPQVKTALRSRTVFGGGWWIRTTEGIASRFTVCPLWPLGKSPKYTMFNWSWWTDSNPRPADYKSAALPTELHQHISRNWRVLPNSKGYYNRGFVPCQSFFEIFFPRQAARVPGGSLIPGQSKQEGEMTTYLPRPRLRPPLWDSQLEAPLWFCPLCGSEQYPMDPGRSWQGRRICARCHARLNHHEREGLS